MITYRKQIGNLGEQLARQYLQDRGYEIMGAGVRTKFGELDLVAREGETIVFIEVKTRRGEEHGTPEEAIDAHKQAHLRACAHAYLSEKNLLAASFRIDAIAIELNEATRKARLRHLKHAVGEA